MISGVYGLSLSLHKISGTHAQKGDQMQKILICLVFCLVFSNSYAQDCIDLVPFAQLHAIKITMRAGAKSFVSDLANENIYVGVFFEMPIYSQKERTDIQEKILGAIADYQNTLDNLSLLQDRLRYHRMRRDKGIEDNKNIISTLKEMVTANNRLRTIKAKLRSWNIDYDSAKKCRF